MLTQERGWGLKIEGTIDLGAGDEVSQPHVSSRGGHTGTALYALRKSHRFDGHIEVRSVKALPQHACWHKTCRRLAIVCTVLALGIGVVIAEKPLAAADLRGLLIENELGGSPMMGVEVSAPGANPTVSTGSGEFRLTFPTKQAGDQIYFVDWRP